MKFRRPPESYPVQIKESDHWRIIQWLLCCWSILDRFYRLAGFAKKTAVTKITELLTVIAIKKSVFRLHIGREASR